MFKKIAKLFKSIISTFTAELFLVFDQTIAMYVICNMFILVKVTYHKGMGSIA